MTLELIFQWMDLLRYRKMNWINLDFCHIGFEFGTYKGTYLEFACVLLGVGFYFEWAHKPSRKAWADEMNARVAEVKAHPERLIPMSEVLADIESELLNNSSEEGA